MISTTIHCRANAFGSHTAGHMCSVHLRATVQVLSIVHLGWRREEEKKGLKGLCGITKTMRNNIYISTQPQTFFFFFWGRNESKLVLIIIIWVTVYNNYLYIERETLELDVAFTLHSTSTMCLLFHQAYFDTMFWDSDLRMLPLLSKVQYTH